jgi:tetratricopeptide (TPR) repeat protein
VPGGLALLALAVFILFNAPVRALWNTNLGAINETRADSFIAPDLPAAERSSLTASAIAWYESALDIVPNQPNASRRLGNLYVALDRFEEAVPLLETALAAEPANPAAIKGLGLAYVWAGRVEDAARTLARLDNRRDMVNELYTWSTFRGEQGHADLAAYAREAADLLSAQ